MNLYLISQDKVDGYDTYSDAVVSAKSAIDARKIHPCGFVTHISNGKWMGTFSGGINKGQEYENETDSWVKYKDIDVIKVELIGKSSVARGLILSSFHAG
jgi:hypothetical protein